MTLMFWQSFRIQKNVVFSLTQRYPGLRLAKAERCPGQKENLFNDLQNNNNILFI